jgi:hypothetical protein
MRTTSKLLASVLLLIGVILASNRGARAQVPLLPRFHCYEVDRGKITSIPGVKLAGPLGTTTVTLRRLERLCNPVFTPDARENPRGLFVDHLTAYDIRASTAGFTPVKNLEVTDEFGLHVIDVLRASFLLVPTSKSLDQSPPPPVPLIDHFECYRIKGAVFRQSGLSITDQFGTATMDVKRPVAFCVPVSKNDEPVPDPDARLMCYDARARPPRPDVGDIFINNQFGAQTIQVTRSRELCVPATVGKQVFTCESIERGDGVCGGTCPENEVCVEGKGNCICVQGCHDIGDGFCGGPCPLNQQCISGQNGCECVPDSELCHLGAGGMCGGVCANPGTSCVYDSDAADCRCVTGTGCGPIGGLRVGACGGMCPGVGLFCALGPQGCTCSAE